MYVGGRGAQGLGMASCLTRSGNVHQVRWKELISGEHLAQGRAFPKPSHSPFLGRISLNFTNEETLSSVLGLCPQQGRFELRSANPKMNASGLPTILSGLRISLTPQRSFVPLPSHDPPPSPGNSASSFCYIDYILPGFELHINGIM